MKKLIKNLLKKRSCCHEWEPLFSWAVEGFNNYGIYLSYYTQRHYFCRKCSKYKEIKTKKINWHEYIEKHHDFILNDIMVYSTKWNEYYYIRRLIYDRSRIKAQLCDIHNTNHLLWADTKYLEMVIKNNL